MRLHPDDLIVDPQIRGNREALEMRLNGDVHASALLDHSRVQSSHDFEPQHEQPDDAEHEAEPRLHDTS